MPVADHPSFQKSRKSSSTLYSRNETIGQRIKYESTYRELSELSIL
jgi:hypothetical protein